MQKFDQNSAKFQIDSQTGLKSGMLPQLRQIIRTGRIPNALLFYGAGGTGKKEAAMEFVKSCNCISGGMDNPIPCNSCTSCKKIDTGMHPDMIFLRPEDNKKNISIAQIRDMGRLISARANEAAYRMVCILDAHLMNVPAQNGLLKVLEEPPEKTFFMLLADGTAPLLPTILSRCRKFRFYPESSDRIREILCTQGIDENAAWIISRTAGPNLDLALEYAGKKEAEGPEWKKLRQWVVKSMLDVITGPVRSRISKGLEFSQKLSADPNRLSSARAIVRTVLRDFCVFRYSPEQIVNLDFFDIFKDISQTHVYPTFLEWLAAFCETEKRLDSNSGQRLALDRFFLELSLSEKGTGPL